MGVAYRFEVRCGCLSVADLVLLPVVFVRRKPSSLCPSPNEFGIFVQVPVTRPPTQGPRTRLSLLSQSGARYTGTEVVEERGEGQRRVLTWHAGPEDFRNTITPRQLQVTLCREVPQRQSPDYPFHGLLWCLYRMFVSWSCKRNWCESFMFGVHGSRTTWKGTMWEMRNPSQDSSPSSPFSFCFSWRTRGTGRCVKSTSTPL